MTVLMPQRSANTLLDYAQVSERHEPWQTSAVTAATRMPDPQWISPLERARLIAESLGGESPADEVEQRAFSAVIEAQLRPVEATRLSLGTLPIDL